ncbi:MULTISPECIES: hypothetical protein [unclassified Nodularia (in: cyanobacteria)]|uniref:hypothetical protein n=1 Tax=unclassified Nodularia (in: cyanobacteria) TaxID=2656917 RepID=UPI00187ED3E3|nr:MULTISPECIES: hypothetical protein [unclassified Nodularia (in: cyanobacteria)]MBE9199352.1 hypothetical protein [Nodularia sp. LEGE 06071]MCC2694132.1 hypothetical protein [Nodularia sp. LEGE 04288]
MHNQPKSLVNELEQIYSQDIQTITRLLAQITNRNPDEIKPHLDTMLQMLVQPQSELPFYETATPQEWVTAFQEWVESYRELNLPTLSDAAISRESIYGERG